MTIVAQIATPKMPTATPRCQKCLEAKNSTQTRYIFTWNLNDASKFNLNLPSARALLSANFTCSSIWKKNWNWGAQYTLAKLGSSAGVLSRFADFPLFLLMFYAEKRPHHQWLFAFDDSQPVSYQYPNVKVWTMDTSSSCPQLEEGLYMHAIICRPWKNLANGKCKTAEELTQP